MIKLSLHKTVLFNL